MSELDLIAAIRKQAGSSGGRALIRGIGDDCAIVRPKLGHDLVYTSDMALEGRHFTLDTHSAADVGHKALARSLSDLAAMGSKPVFFLVSLAFPQRLGKRWLNGFYRGLLTLAEQHRIALAGGDLANYDRVLVDVTCSGEVPAGTALLRSGAKPGDVLYVTGLLGRAAHALAADLRRYRKFQLRPEPQVELGQRLRKLGVSSCIDLSDGLSLDLHRICQESKVSAILEHVPAASAVTEEEALHGGEDYQLLFTAPKTKRIPADVAIPIGQMVPRGKSSVYYRDRPLTPAGFDHFA
jgi:thiamine-monophosphate kinase